MAEVFTFFILSLSICNSFLYSDQFDQILSILLAANYDDSDKMKSIKKAVTTISFKKIPPRLLRVYLDNILQKENEKLSPGSLIKVIDKSKGDIRSMINLTQSLIKEPGLSFSFSFSKILSK